MDDTLFGSDPAELRVGDEVSPCGTPVCDEGLEGLALDAVGEEGDGLADNLVAAADCEGLIQQCQQE